MKSARPIPRPCGKRVWSIVRRRLHVKWLSTINTEKCSPPSTRSQFGGNSFRWLEFQQSRSILQTNLLSDPNHKHTASRDLDECKREKKHETLKYISVANNDEKCTSSFQLSLHRIELRERRYTIKQYKEALQYRTRMKRCMLRKKTVALQYRT